MEEIGKILPAVFKKQVRRADPPLVELLAPLWPRVAGKAIAEHARPIRFAAGTLVLAASCSSWATELRLMAEEIRAEINSFLGGPVVKKLRVEHHPQLDLMKASMPRRDLKPDSGPGMPDLPGGKAKLDPEISGIVERSFAKYFARRGRQVH